MSNHRRVPRYHHSPIDSYCQVYAVLAENNAPVRACFNLLLVIGVGLLAGCGRSEQPKPLQPSIPPAARSAAVFRAHFTGTTRLSADTNAAPWISIGQLPSFQALRRQTLEKLSQAPHDWAQHRIATTNDFAGAFQELIADLIRAESFVEVAGDSNRTVEVALALRLPTDRAEYWQTNLLAILEAWTGCRGERLPADPMGWQLRKHHEPDLFRLVRSGNWTLVGWGQDQLHLQDEYRMRIKQTGSPGATTSNAWLEVFLDFPNLAAVWRSAFTGSGVADTPGGGILSARSWPAVELLLNPYADNLQLKGSFVFRDAFSFRPEVWQIPTNFIHEPIISFTAIQGVAPIVESFLDSLGVHSLSPPNQLFVWAGGNFPVQTLAAAPMPHAEEYVRNLAPPMIERFNPALQAMNAGFLSLTSNAPGVQTIRWAGIPPWVTPYISSATDSGVDFLMAGTYPDWVGTNPPPVLFHNLLGRTNLVYYDWEVTAAHVQSWRAVINVIRHFFEKPRLRPESPSIVFLDSVSNRLGNVITEITRSDSNRLALVRQGPVGLTGLELIALAHWLESTNFPLNGLALAAWTNAPPARSRQSQDTE